MKLVISVTLLLAALAMVNGGCYYNSLMCFHIKLDSEKPFLFNESFYSNRSTEFDELHDLNITTAARILHANGSIGQQTFLMLPQLEELAIHSGNFDRIEDGALCSIPKLKQLFIYRIEHPDLTKSVLSNCENLKSLWISGFELKVEPDAFKSMINLEKLNLREIHIPHLTKEYLEPLVNLKSLDINAVMEDIDPGALCSPPKLEVLHIIRSNISQTVTKSMLQNCSHVKEFIIEQDNLSLGENAIEEGALGVFTNILTVRFKHLAIPHLKRTHLTGLSNVRVLEILSCGVSEIDIDTFLDLNKLIKLSLGANKLTHFNSNIIKPLPNLYHLELSENNLESIDKIIHPMLRNLMASKNSIKKLDASAIKTNLPALMVLNIGCNQISEEDIEALKTALGDVAVITDICGLIPIYK